MQELKYILLFIPQLFVTLIYKALPANTSSSRFKFQILLRKLYGLVFGLCFATIMYTREEVLICLLSYFIAYRLSFFCVNERRTMIVNFINFSFLTLSQINRFIYYEKDVLDISLALMLSIP